VIRKNVADASSFPIAVVLAERMGFDALVGVPVFSGSLFSGRLLAYLAAGTVSYGSWIRFVLPLVLMLALLCAIALLVAGGLGL